MDAAGHFIEPGTILIIVNHLRQQGIL
jgi:hypothetical protein